MNALVDSVLNLSIAVDDQNDQLNEQKVDRLRSVAAGRKIWTVKPTRPERKGLVSEIIIEKKLMLGK